MASRQAGYKARMLAALMVVFACWANVTIAGVNDDLLEAATRGDLPAVKGLIAKGADVNTKARNGTTVLMVASAGGFVEVVQLLLAKGADVNTRRYDGGTALIAASDQSHKEVVELLLARGADVNARDNDGKSALIHSHQRGITELLIRAGAK